MARKTKVTGNFISGLSAPVRVDGDGGLSVVEGDEYVASIIRMALLPSESSNPFMTDSFTRSAVFNNASDPLTTGRLTAQVNQVFERLDRENIASLVSIKQLSAEDGQLTVQVIYINKENNRQSEVTTVVDTSRKAGLL